MTDKFVQVNDVKELRIGDRIRHITGNYQTLVVVANEDGKAIAVDTWEVTNPEEWMVAR